MAKRRKRYYDSYMAVKSHGRVVSKRTSAVHAWDVEELAVNQFEGSVNRKRRSRVGHVETRKNQ